MVHILGGRKIEPGRIRLRSLGNGIDGFECLLSFRGTEDADLFYAASPRTVDGQFVGQQTAVKRKRALKLIKEFVRRPFEYCPPTLARFASFFPLLHDPVSFAGTVTGNAKRFMNPSASFGL